MHALNWSLEGHLCQCACSIIFHSQWRSKKHAKCH